MHTRVIHNHQLIEASRARLSAISSAALYGRGVFTTIAIYNGHPFLWTEHWGRLSAHAGRAGVDPGDFDEETVRALLTKLITANEVVEGRARVTLFADRVEGAGIWELKDGASSKTELLIMTGERREVTEEGLALTVSPYRINTHSPLTGVKSINYLEHILALEEAGRRDFDEAVMVNERGEIVSAAMANLFWVTHGAIHTPALAVGALAGTTRARIIELAEELSIPLIEGVYDLAQLSNADEVFLTSAGLGVAIVTAFDFHRYTIPVGSAAVRLREAFRQLTLHTT